MGGLLILPWLLLLAELGGAEAGGGTAMAMALRAEKTAAGAAPSKLFFKRDVTLTVSVTVGSPPQNLSMVLDTGSELSWLQCPGPAFRPNLSATYLAIPFANPACRDRTRDLPSPPFPNPSNRLCRVSVSYADGSSADGDLSSDVLRLGQAPAVRALFSCVQTPPSSPGAAGLLGLNQGSLSFISQMGAKKFSYCISAGSSDGVLLLGGVAPLVPLNYTPLVRISLPLPYFDRVAYSVQLEGIRVGAAVLPIPKAVLEPDHTGAGQTIVDSGTQFSFLLGPAYAVLKTEFLRQTRGLLAELGEPGFAFQGAFDTCFRLPAAAAPPREKLPTVALMLRGGAEVAVAAELLLYPAAGQLRRGGKEAVWCLTFGNSELVPLESYIIGHHHQQNLWVEYDLQLARLGFGPVRCDVAAQRLARLV
ncbi:aspartic proteinase PCS1-like [Wolffia australiana]